MHQAAGYGQKPTRKSCKRLDHRLFTQAHAIALVTSHSVTQRHIKR
jgi:hypothetical protein